MTIFSTEISNSFSKKSKNMRTTQEIALACANLPPFGPIWELAMGKLASEDIPRNSGTNVCGIWLHSWQVVVFEAQIMALLGGIGR